MLIFGPSSLAAVPSGSAKAGEVTISDEARRQFKAGVALLGDPAGPRYEEAYRAFKAAYASSPSPKILGNLALCAMNLERDSEAIDAYGKYLAEVPDIDSAERAQIKKDLELLQTGLVTVELSVSPGDASVNDERVPVSGARIANSYEMKGETLTLGLRPGHHVVKIRRDGYEPQEWEFDAAPGERLQKTVKLERLRTGQPTPGEASAPAPGGEGAGEAEDEADSSIPVSAWAMLATTLAVGVGAGVVGGLALSNKGSFDDAVAAGDLTEAESLKSTGETLNITTDVLIGTAAAAAVVTVILFIVRPGGETEAAAEADEPSEDAQSARGWRPAPLVTEGGVGLGLSGWF